MKRLRTGAAGIALLLLCASGTVAQDTVRGSLVIIGGGGRTDEIMSRFVDLADAKGSGSILVLPMASSIPDTVGPELAQELRDRGARRVVWANLTRERALDPATAALFDSITGVFFSGGDQSRITAAIGGTPVHRRLLQLYREGAAIGGTSAGAAVMSRIMITGNEKLNRDSTQSYVFVRKGNIETTEGLGFLPTAIVDQHFIRRKRHNRLLTVALEHPDLPCLGIDESTALIVRNGVMCEVVGEGTVLVVDAAGAHAIGTDKSGNLSGHNLRLHLLRSGDRFDLRSRTALRP